MDQLTFTDKKMDDEPSKTEPAPKVSLSNRNPKCARCRNHSMVNSLKGHKHCCPWRNCNCERCQVVIERQKITAARVASLRQQRKLSNREHGGTFPYPVLTEPPQEAFSATKSYYSSADVQSQLNRGKMLSVR